MNLQPLPLAFAVEDLTGILAIGLSLGIPIVAILTSHQRKMAEMMAEQHRAIMDLENRKLQAQQAAPPAMDVHAQYELQMMRDRLAQMEAKLSAAEAPRSESRQSIG